MGPGSKSKKDGKDQESIQSIIKPKLGHHIGKEHKHNKHHTQESQEVRSFPEGDHKATTNIQENATNTKDK